MPTTQHRQPAIVARMRDYESKPTYKQKQRNAVKRFVFHAIISLSVAAILAILSIMAISPDATNYPM